jgi:hypothetical protein
MRVAVPQGRAGDGEKVGDLEGLGEVRECAAAEDLDAGGRGGVRSDHDDRGVGGGVGAECGHHYFVGGETIGQRVASGLRWLAADHQGTGTVSLTADGNQTLTKCRQTPSGETRGRQ